MTRKEYIDAKVKELQKKQSKDQIIKSQDKKTSDERELESLFFKALASRDRTELSRVNELVAKEYKEKAQTVGTSNQGGVLVPTTISQSIITKMHYISPMRQIATVIPNMPAKLTLPSENALPTVYWVDEGAPGTDSSATIDSNQLLPYKYMGLDSFTSEVIADAATNPAIQNYVEDRFAVAMALFENAVFVNGDGSSKPYGFRSSAITPNSVAQQNDLLVYNDVTNLKYSLGTAYRQLAVFVTSSAGAQALENVKDNQGRPIWRDGLAEGTPATLLGRPVYVVDEIPSNLGTLSNATELWFGMFQNYFIGDRGAMRMDYGTNGTDFANDKISLRLAKRVAGRPVIGESFSKLTGVFGQ